MRLKIILLFLSIQTFIAILIGGYQYYSTLKKSILEDFTNQAVIKFEMRKRNLNYYLSESTKPIKTLAGLPALSEVLLNQSTANLDKVNQLLDHYQKTLQLGVCYLINAEGVTIASSNRHSDTSFVSQNFSFRPYFNHSINGKPDVYLALGTTSHVRGAYYSHPVYAFNKNSTTEAIGVVVAKATIELIEQRIAPEENENLLLVDPFGIIFVSTIDDFKYHSIKPLTPQVSKIIKDSKQFGEGPWNQIFFKKRDDIVTIGPDKKEYLSFQSPLELFKDWQLIYLVNMDDIKDQIAAPFINIGSKAIIFISVIISLAVFVLYLMALKELKKRKNVEDALKESEKRYRFIYHRTPGLLHSINQKKELINVSDHWLKTMGYDREEVMGKKLTNFLTPASKDYAERVIFPSFFKNGFCNEIPYEFVKKNGEVIDILSSTFGDRDGEGNVVRSFAVSANITVQKETERALKKARDELDHYSKNLERIVSYRTSEIQNLLKYSPAVVYIKNKKGEYRLVNSHFEKLFRVKQSDIIGKTDFELFESEIAEKLTHNDQKVVTDRDSCQMEEIYPQNGGISTFLTITFPIYDDDNALNGIGGILTDITTLKRAEEQLKRFSRDIISSQELERSKIARELHDELGQMLTAFSIDMAWLGKLFKEKNSQNYQRIKQMDKQINKTITDVRNLSFRIRPGVLDDLGLADALDWLIQDFEKRTQTSCLLRLSGVKSNIKKVSSSLSTAVYRIAQEALTNVTRHAEASNVEVELILMNEALEMTIEDNGNGFDLDDYTKYNSLGLVGMKERASLLGGKVTIQSRLTSGTSIHCRFPLQCN
ncbi:MAG: PAS domain S-box protein [Deltaproteobacteria bacterium]|jgi:PAS domain S-box-containing protein|nr:PAS domain S-box protein [Deltaproteobacteria bacterium]